jgi:hypothetical protein
MPWDIASLCGFVVRYTYLTAQAIGVSQAWQVPLLLWTMLGRMLHRQEYVGKNQKNDVAKARRL